jgi:hypothetical protein
MSAIYEESKLDNHLYCRTNGQFTRHLREYSLSYQDYYEKYITGIAPTCRCGNKLSFYQHNNSYAKSCGADACVGKSISASKQNSPLEIKQQQSKNYSAAHANKTTEQLAFEHEKRKATCLSKYGVSAVTQTEEFKKKAKSAKLAKYGNEYYSGWEASSRKNREKTELEQIAINDKRRATNLLKFGVQCSFLRPGVLSKAAKSNATGKDFTLPSGKVIGLRGYEHLVVTQLLQKYSETELILHDQYTSYQLPTFSYIDNRRHHLKYYPDIFIPSENKIIEVKARWWWDGNGEPKYNTRFENNLKKRAAVLEKGFLYEVWLFETKQNYKVLPNDSDF